MKVKRKLKQAPYDFRGIHDVCPTCGKRWSWPCMAGIKVELGPRFSVPPVLGLTDDPHPRWWCGSFPCTVHLARG